MLERANFFTHMQGIRFKSCCVHHLFARLANSPSFPDFAPRGTLLAYSA
jgi:hypothetical protein